MKHIIRIALAVFSLHAAAADKPAAWQPLLDASLSKFDVYLSWRGDQILSVLKGTAPADLQPLGLNPPGQNVIRVIEFYRDLEIQPIDAMPKEFAKYFD